MFMRKSLGKRWEQLRLTEGRNNTTRNSGKRSREGKELREAEEAGN